MRTIKKSAAKSSVSRSVLRSAVKKSSGAAEKKASGWTGKKKSAKSGARKPAAKAKKGSHYGSVAVDWVHQPSVIREPKAKTWRPFGIALAPKDR